jgi:hypothetical protein
MCASSHSLTILRATTVAATPLHPFFTLNNSITTQTISINTPQLLACPEAYQTFVGHLHHRLILPLLPLLYRMVPPHPTEPATRQTLHLDTVASFLVPRLTLSGVSVMRRSLLALTLAPLAPTKTGVEVGPTVCLMRASKMATRPSVQLV